MEPAASSLFDFNVFGWPWTGLVTLFTLLVYFAFLFKVGRARSKYGVPAPQIDGPNEFRLAHRIQVNTGEHLIIFLPLLWIAALSTIDGLAASIGVIWPLSRIWYAAAYTKNPPARHPPFMVGVGVVVVLFALVAFELGHSLFFWHDEGAGAGMSNGAALGASPTN